MMGGGTAKVEELMLHLPCREFQPFFVCVGLNVNDVTFSSPSERQSYQATEAPQTYCVADIRMTTRLFLSRSIPWEIFSRFYCRWGKMQNAMGNKDLATFMLLDYCHSISTLIEIQDLVSKL